MTLPLDGHEFVVWRQTRPIVGFRGRTIDYDDFLMGCTCGTRADGMGSSNGAMWFIGHCLTLLGAKVDGPRGLTDDEAQAIWFSEELRRG